MRGFDYLKTIVVIASLLAAFGAQAAAGGHSEDISRFFTLWSTDRAQGLLRKQAACAVRKFPVDARKVIVEDLTIQDIAVTAPNLLKPCFSGAFFKQNTFSISQPVFEFVLAEAFVGQLPQDISLAPLTNTAPLKRDKLPEQNLAALPASLRQSIEATAIVLRLDATAECAVRRDPREALVLVQSIPGSQYERESLTRVQSIAWSCDPVKTEAPAFILRGIVAYNLYRLMDAAHLVGDRENGSNA